MNYRHAFHAGNFADVVKHAVLWRILAHLLNKPAPFRVIDTHAGAGLYDLTGAEAQRSPEWREGIARLLPPDGSGALPPAAATLIAGYLDIVRAANKPGSLTAYPGSPLIVRACLRAQDRLIACELEPQAAGALARHLRGERRAKAIRIDGWTALAAYLPPKERRGLVLIDPPFEAGNEFERLAEGLLAAWRKWPTGIFLAWYPIKSGREPADLTRRLARGGLGKSLRVELLAQRPPGDTRLRGTGQIVVNPPWRLDEELRLLLPAIAKRLNGHANGAVNVAPFGAAGA
ncbi:MAG: 23S rRNA (adenine(2030)-N(6))-methyltransferase RlmJ [Pseudorhodoplanes sp.]